MQSRVAIIDSGGANIASLSYALERLGAASELTTDPARIRAAERVILPGVGAAADAMQRLRAARLDRLIPELTQPVLGICLGMQLLARHSGEQDTDCLGVLAADAHRLDAAEGHAVPNMGWCRTTRNAEHPLLEGLGGGAWFYFVHSYALPVDANCIATAWHSTPFSAALSAGNFHAAQFHPERSADAGARFLRNFLELPACS